MASAVLVLHTSCVSNGENTKSYGLNALNKTVGAESAPPNDNGDAEIAAPSCDFIIIPQLPVLENEHSIADSLHRQRQPQSAAAVVDVLDRSTWKEALSYQPMQYEKKFRHRLNPCGWKNVVVFSDLPPFYGDPSFLLTIASCSVDFVGDIDEKVSVDGVHQGRSVQAFPSNFAFTLDELINLDALLSSSQSQFVGFAEIKTTFDFQVYSHVLTAHWTPPSTPSVNHTQATSEPSRPSSVHHAQATNGDSQYRQSSDNDLNKAFLVEPTVSKPADCICQCSDQTSEFPLLFFQTMAENETSDFKTIMMIQAGIGAFISFLFVWVGTKVFRTQHYFWAPKSINFVKGASISAQDNHQRCTDEAKTPGEQIDSERNDNAVHSDQSEQLPSQVTQNASVQVCDDLSCQAKEVASAAPPQNGSAQRQHIVVKSKQLGDSIPDDSALVCVDDNDDDSCHHENRHLEHVSSFSPTMIAVGDESQCSVWTSQWLQNKALRRSLRRSKREGKQYQGRPLFITPVIKAAIVPSCHQPSTVIPVAACVNEQEKMDNDLTDWVDSNVLGPRSTFGESTLLTEDSFIRDYWGL